MPTPPATKVVVPIKSGWFSKINWTGAMGIIFMLLALFGLPIADADQASIIAAIGILSNFLIMIWRQWFTSSVTASSLPPGALSE